MRDGACKKAKDSSWTRNPRFAKRKRTDLDGNTVAQCKRLASKDELAVVIVLLHAGHGLLVAGHAVGFVV